MKGAVKYFYLALFVLAVNYVVSQDRKIDSLKAALKYAKHDTVRCNILFTLTDMVGDEGMQEKYNDQMIKIAEAHYLEKGRDSKFYRKILAIGFNVKAVQMENRGEIAKTLNYFFRSLKMAEEIGDEKQASTCLNNIGLFYFYQEDYKTALHYYYRSIKLTEKINDLNELSSTLLNCGSVYFKQKDFEKANEFFLRSLAIKEKMGDKIGTVVPLNNLGIICFKQGNFPKALEYYNRSLKINEETNDKNATSFIMNNIALVMLNTNNIDKSLEYATKGLQIAKELGFPRAIMNSAITIKKIYKKQNKYKEAFEMYELEIKMRDSINNTETQKAAVKKQMQYEYEKKELETKAEQEKKDIVAKEELKQKEKERNYFIAGFGLVMVLALFIFRGYRQKQKANVVISEQKHLVEEKQKEIIDSIHYAQRIQRALITPEKYIDKKLNDLQK